MGRPLYVFLVVVMVMVCLQGVECQDTVRSRVVLPVSCVGGEACIGFSTVVTFGAPEFLQTFTFLLDTGSSIFAVAASNMNSSLLSGLDVNGLGNTASFFRTANCSSAEINGQPACVGKQIYGQGRWQGFTMRGSVFAQGLSFSQEFAVVSVSEDFFQPAFQGVIGMSRGSDNEDFPGYMTFVESLVDTYGLYHSFAFCFDTFSGAVVIGDPDLRLYKQNTMQNFSFSNAADAYQLYDATFITPHGVVVTADVMIDTGVTMIAVPPVIYSDLFEMAKPFFLNETTTIHVSSLHHLKTFTVDLTNTQGLKIQYEFHPKHYFQCSGHFCIWMIQNANDFGIAILGKYFIQRFYVVFDIAWGVVGIAEKRPVPCASALVTSTDVVTRARIPIADPLDDPANIIIICFFGILMLTIIMAAMVDATRAPEPRYTRLISDI